MSYYSCKGGDGFSILDALWCQIYQELTKKVPYAVHGHYTFWDWLELRTPHEPHDEDPSYYTVEPFDGCSEGATFDSWYKDNYAEAAMCRDSLTRLNKQCYDARLIGTNWLGYRKYQVVPSGKPPEPRSCCDFMLKRAAIDEHLWSMGR